MFIKKINLLYVHSLTGDYLVKHFVLILIGFVLIFASDISTGALILPFIAGICLIPFPYVHALKILIAHRKMHAFEAVDRLNFSAFIFDKKLKYLKRHIRDFKEQSGAEPKNLPYSRAPLIASHCLRSDRTCTLIGKNYNHKHKDSIRPVNIRSHLYLKEHSFAKDFIDKSLVFLGSGFIWNTAHLRASYRSLSEAKQSKAHGLALIHALDVDNYKSLCFASSDLSTHTLIFGTTGSGKTRFYDLLCFQAIERGECVIVLDPKGDRDLRNTLDTACSLCGRAGDFLELDYMHHSTSCSLNPLSATATDTAIAQRIASLLGGSGSAESFKSAAFQALAASVGCLRFNGQAITIDAIRETIVNHDNYAKCLYDFVKKTVQSLDKTDVTEFFRRLGSVPKLKSAICPISPDNLEKIYSYMVSKGYIQHDPAFFTIKSMALYDRAYYLKMTAIVHPVLNALCAGSLYQLLSSDRAILTGLREIIDKKKVLYVPLYSLSNATLGSYLGRLILSELSHCAGDIYARGVTGGRVSIYVDEASEIADEPLVQLLNKARGANFALTVATQSFDDLVKRAGSEAAAHQIIANCNTIISLRVLDSHTASVICSRMPVTTISKISTSNSYSNSDSLNVSTATTRSVSLHESSLVNEQLLMNLPDLEFFAKLAGSQVVKGILPLSIAH